MMNHCLNRRLGTEPGVRHDGQRPTCRNHPLHFGVKSLSVQPMKCLSHRHQVNRLRCQSGLLRQARNVRQPIPALGGAELRPARIGSYHPLKVRRQQSRGLAVPGGAVPRGAPLGRQGSQPREQLRRIPRPEFRIGSGIPREEIVKPRTDHCLELVSVLHEEKDQSKKGQRIGDHKTDCRDEL